MLNRIRYVILTATLAAVASLVSSCEKKTIDDDPGTGLGGLPEKEKTTFALFTNLVKNPAYNGLSKPCCDLLIAYNEPENHFFNDGVYVSIEKYSGGTLQFLVGKEVGVIIASDIMTNIFSDENYSPEFGDDEYYQMLPKWVGYDYYRNVFLVAPEPGEFVFRLKFEQPQQDIVLFSPKYRLRINQDEICDEYGYISYSYFPSIVQLD